jgi:hypothetical protein
MVTSERFPQIADTQVSGPCEIEEWGGDTWFEDPNRELYVLSVRGNFGACQVQLEFNDGTLPLQVQAEFETGRKECCNSPCIPDDGGPAVVCIGERDDGTPWDTLETNFGRGCDVVVP